MLLEVQNNRALRLFHTGDDRRQWPYVSKESAQGRHEYRELRTGEFFSVLLGRRNAVTKFVNCVVN